MQNTAFRRESVNAVLLPLKVRDVDDLLTLVRGLPLATCGRIGALVAAEVISHYGARPECSLQDLARAAELI